MHEVLFNRLGGLSLPRKSVVRLTDRPDMTLDVYRGRKTTIQQNHDREKSVNLGSCSLPNHPLEKQSGLGFYHCNPFFKVHGYTAMIFCHFQKGETFCELLVASHNNITFHSWSPLIRKAGMKKKELFPLNLYSYTIKRLLVGQMNL